MELRGPDSSVAALGTGLAERVREGSEAEARRVVAKKLLLQIAIVQSFCSVGFGGREDVSDA